MQKRGEAARLAAVKANQNSVHGQYHDNEISKESRDWLDAIKSSTKRLIQNSRYGIISDYQDGSSSLYGFKK